MTVDNTYNEESVLVERIQQGDKDAERALVEKYQRGIFAILKNRCSDHQICQDVSQETWFLVIKKVRQGELRDPRRLSGFVTQIARNQLTMALRSTTKESQVSSSLDMELKDNRFAPEPNIENKQLGLAMAKLLANMGRTRDRELILRFYYYGDSKAELCQRFELSPASFDAVLARARNRFKERWQNVV